MFDVFVKYPARAKVAADWVTMPEEDCRVVPVYEQPEKPIPGRLW